MHAEAVDSSRARPERREAHPRNSPTSAGKAQQRQSGGSGSATMFNFPGHGGHGMPRQFDEMYVRPRPSFQHGAALYQIKSSPMGAPARQARRLPHVRSTSSVTLRRDASCARPLPCSRPPAARPRPHPRPRPRPAGAPHRYSCFPGAFAGKEGMEEGDKIILPESALDAVGQATVWVAEKALAWLEGGGRWRQPNKTWKATATHHQPPPLTSTLDRRPPPDKRRPPTAADKRRTDDAWQLARLDVEYPMLFQLTNKQNGNVTHCGVLEFSAPEGNAFVPYWTMSNLMLPEGGLIQVKNVSLPKATYVKFQPQHVDFLDINNPRAVLEFTLRSFSCVTKGDQLCIPYNDKKYYLEVRPRPNAPTNRRHRRRRHETRRHRCRHRHCCHHRRHPHPHPHPHPHYHHHHRHRHRRSKR